MMLVVIVFYHCSCVGIALYVSCTLPPSTTEFSTKSAHPVCIHLTTSPLPLQVKSVHLAFSCFITSTVCRSIGYRSGFQHTFSGWNSFRISCAGFGYSSSFVVNRIAFFYDFGAAQTLSRRSQTLSRLSMHVSTA